MIMVSVHREKVTWDWDDGQGWEMNALYLFFDSIGVLLCEGIEVEA